MGYLTSCLIQAWDREQLAIQETHEESRRVWEGSERLYHHQAMKEDAFRALENIPSIYD